MPFRLSKSTREWFKHIRDQFDVDFDMYYFCAVVGLLKGEKQPVATAEAPELVEYFPDLHRAHGNLMIGLVLVAELRAAGLATRDKKLVHRVVRDLINPASPSRLSDQGFAAINAYAEAGGRALRAEFEEPPQLRSEFLVRYSRFVEQITPQPLAS